MTDEEEFAARSQLKWAREGDVWILLYRRRRMGRVVPDKDHSCMWRSVKVDGILSDTANLPWSKDNVMAQAISGDGILTNPWSGECGPISIQRHQPIANCPGVWSSSIKCAAGFGA